MVVHQIHTGSDEAISDDAVLYNIGCGNKHETHAGSTAQQ